jgi:dTDP-4-amino-4,6-dideoxygalactose transaminase
VQLKKLPLNNERRQRMTRLYRAMLAGYVPDLHMPFSEKDGRGSSCYHILPALLPVGVDRYAFMEGMKARGVQTSIHYPPVHHFQIYRCDALRGLLPLTEEAASREVTLPLYPTMREEQVDWVVRAAGDVLKEMNP